MVLEQQALAAAVADVRQEAEPVQGHDELTTCLKWLAVKLGWPSCAGNRWAAPAGAAEGWDREQLKKARRVICGHVSSTGCAVHDAKGELRELVSTMASAGTKLMETAASACVAEWSSNMESLEKSLRVMVRYVRRLQGRVRRGGPARAGRLRELSALPERVRTWALAGQAGPMPERLSAVLDAARTLRAEAHAGHCARWCAGPTGGQQRKHRWPLLLVVAEGRSRADRIDELESSTWRWIEGDAGTARCAFEGSRRHEGAHRVGHVDRDDAQRARQ